MKESASQSAEAVREIHAALSEAVELGRLPRDLELIIKTQLPKPDPVDADAAGAMAGARAGAGEGNAPGPVGRPENMASTESGAEDDDLDAPTVPHAVVGTSSLPHPGAGAPGRSYLPPLPYLTTPPALAGDEMRAKVDEVVLGSLVGDYKGFRKARETGELPVRSAEKPEKVDQFLTGFKSARFRSDARRAASGRSRGAASVEDFDGGGQPRATVGSILRNRFILDEEIGRGGMGVVYSAVDRRRLEAGHDQPYVAIKLLSDAFRSNADALRLMEAEARKAQSLAHPNVTSVYDFDRDGGEAFIVMELLQGKVLDRRLAERVGQALPGEEARRILRELCSGLAYAHSRGVIHSDLKPGNIYVLPDGSVKLLDFGLAAAAKAADGAQDLAGALTTSYASPEMFEGAPRDPRDDIFALGCLAYQMLSGRHPFAMRPANEVAASGERLRPLDRTDPRLWEAIRRALSFGRDQRLGSVAEFQAALPG